MSETQAQPIGWSLTDRELAEAADHYKKHVWRERWPWRPGHDNPLLALPPVPENGHALQVFVRLDLGWEAWRCLVTLNGESVGVPIAREVVKSGDDLRWIGMLPVPTPHVTVRRYEREQDGRPYIEIAVTTEGGAR